MKKKCLGILFHDYGKWQDTHLDTKRVCNQCGWVQTSVQVLITRVVLFIFLLCLLL